MRRIFTLILISVFVFGCKTNQFKNKLKTGLWVTDYTLDSIDFYKAKEKYRKNVPVKTWKKFKNKKLEKKEKFVGNICYTTNYQENGKIESFGKIKMIDEKTETHWFYFGDWMYYDNSGKLIRIAKYENGKLISEQIF
jgi:antitoxin component YwqK of YwqJK toxin-antitoxin module